MTRGKRGGNRKGWEQAQSADRLAPDRRGRRTRPSRRCVESRLCGLRDRDDGVFLVVVASQHLQRGRAQRPRRIFQRGGGADGTARRRRRRVAGAHGGARPRPAHPEFSALAANLGRDARGGPDGRRDRARARGGERTRGPRPSRRCGLRAGMASAGAGAVRSRQAGDRSGPLERAGAREAQRESRLRPDAGRSSDPNRRPRADLDVSSRQRRHVSSHATPARRRGAGDRGDAEPHLDPRTHRRAPVPFRQLRQLALVERPGERHARGHDRSGTGSQADRRGRRARGCRAARRGRSQRPAQPAHFPRAHARSAGAGARALLPSLAIR